MENLTLEELIMILQWHNTFFENCNVYSTSHFRLKEKVLQAIADKDFDEKRLQF